MNVRSGIYYSTDGVGSFIWTRIEEGFSIEEIAHAVTAEYEVSLEQARGGVQRIISKLLDEGVVVPGIAPKGELNRPASCRGERRPYNDPCLTVYRDMGDLLALDPPAPSVLDLRRKE